MKVWGAIEASRMWAFTRLDLWHNLYNKWEEATMSSRKFFRRKLRPIHYAAFFILIYLASGTPANESIRVAAESPEWRTTEGLIYTKEVRLKWSLMGISYAPHLSYRYTILGRSYSSTVLSAGGASSYSDPQTAEEAMRGYTAGEAVTVYFDLENHSRSVLEPGGEPGAAVQVHAAAYWAAAFFLVWALVEWTGERFPTIDRIIRTPWDIDWGLWLNWIAAHAVGLFAGIWLSNLIVIIFPIAIIFALIGARSMLVLALIPIASTLAWLTMIALGISAGQRLVLRLRIKKWNPWMWRSAAGMFVGNLIFFYPVRVLNLLFPESPDLMRFMVLGAAALVRGGTIAGAQYTVLRQRLKRAEYWIPLYILASLVAFGLTLDFLARGQAFESAAELISPQVDWFFWTLLLATALEAAITGFGALRLLKLEKWE